MNDEQIARRYCEILGEDPEEMIPDFFADDPKVQVAPRYITLVPHVKKMRAMMQAIGESMLSRIDELIRE